MENAFTVVKEGISGLNPTSATGLFDRMVCKDLGLSVALKQRELTDYAVVQGLERAGAVVCAPDSAERTIALECLHGRVLNVLTSTIP